MPDAQLRRNRKNALDVVRIAHDASAARFDDERLRFQVVERGLHFGLAGVHHRLAARLLIAARGEREQRERIAVGHGVLLLDEHPQHAGFERRENDRIHSHGAVKELRTV